MVTPSRVLRTLTASLLFVLIAGPLCAQSAATSPTVIPASTTVASAPVAATPAPTALPPAPHQSSLFTSNVGSTPKIAAEKSAAPMERRHTITVTTTVLVLSCIILVLLIA